MEERPALRETATEVSSGAERLSGDSKAQKHCCAADDQLTAILDEYGTLLHRAVRSCCAGATELNIAEVEQDARVRVWQSLRRERTIRNAASYLYTAAATATIDALRRIRTRREVPLESDRASVARPGPHESVQRPGAIDDGQLEARHLRELIQDARSRLIPSRRRAVGLHLQGFTPREMAGMLGWTEARARNLVSRGLSDLRRELGKRGVRVGRQ